MLAAAAAEMQVVDVRTSGDNGTGGGNGSGPANTAPRITVMSRDHPVGNQPNAFVSWGDRMTLSSYAEDKWPFPIVDFYYRIAGHNDSDRHRIGVNCWKAGRPHCTCSHCQYVYAYMHAYCCYAPAPREGGIKRWCASDVCLSV